MAVAIQTNQRYGSQAKRDALVNQYNQRKSSGGSSGASPAPSAPSAPSVPSMQPMGSFTNTSQNNPAMEQWLRDFRQFQGDHVGRYEDRLSSDTTQRAIDRATGQIGDIGAAQKKGLEGNLQRRGILGGGTAAGGFEGAGSQLASDIDARTQRLQAGTAADISLGRERDLDALTLAGSGVGQGYLSGLSGARGVSELGLAERGLGLQQWQMQDQAQLDRARLAQAAENADYARLLAAIDSLRSF